MDPKEFILGISSKRIHAMRGDASKGDLALQEFEIVECLSSCTTLDDVNILIDKLLMYVSLSKRVKTDRR